MCVCVCACICNDIHDVKSLRSPVITSLICVEMYTSSIRGKIAIIIIIINPLSSVVESLATNSSYMHAIHFAYSSEEECTATYQKFNGRWYAQRQLSCQFCPVQRWRNAICGKRVCPISQYVSHFPMYVFLAHSPYRFVQSEEVSKRKTLQLSPCVQKSSWSLFQSRSRPPSHLSLPSPLLQT